LEEKASRVRWVEKQTEELIILLFIGEIRTGRSKKRRELRAELLQETERRGGLRNYRRTRRCGNLLTGWLGRSTARRDGGD